MHHRLSAERQESREVHAKTDERQRKSEMDPHNTLVS